MGKINKANNIDIRSVRWGTPPAPLLPRSLRAAWASDSLPEWVSAETGLLPNATLADLGPSVWKTMGAMSPRLRYFLLFLIRTRVRNVEKLRCIDRIWPLGLKVSDIGWTVRTRNRLEQKGYLDDEQHLVNLTFADLFEIEGMGAMTVLDFCSTLEGAMDFYEQLASDYAESHIKDKPTDFLPVLEEVAGEEWSAQISKQDPRFASLLPSRHGQGTLQDRIEQLLSEPDGIDSVADVPLLITSITTIQQQIERLQGQPLEDCLFNFLKLISKTEGNRLEALAARFGWNGYKIITLEECGQQLGITRERVRQIQNKVLKQMPDHEVFMPRLDHALALLEEHAPLTLEQASTILQDAGITRTKFHPESLLEAAQLLGKNTALRICDTRTGKMLVSDNSAKSVQLIPVLGRKLAGQSGVTSVFRVLDALEATGYEIKEEGLRRMLHASSNLQFLDDDWFWVSDIPIARNRLRNVTRKILSVASPQTLLSIRDGVRKVYRWRTVSQGRYKNLIVPPLEVMRAFFEKHSDFVVVGDLVYPALPLDYAKELGETDRTMVDVLRSSPAGVLDRKSFAEGCLVRGMNENTFSVYSTYSCILEHVGIDIWKLRGVKVDPAAIEAVRIANHLKPREKRVLEHGWADDGKLWIAARIPRLGKNSMVIGCPGAIQRYLIGQEFDCRTKEGNYHCGTVSINEKGSSYGYGVFIRRSGLDENDILLAEFDLSTNTVLLSAGNDEILNEAL